MKRFVLLCILLISFFVLVGCVRNINRTRRFNQDLAKQDNVGSTPVNESRTYQQGPGDYDYSLQIDGKDRKYLVHIPKSYDKNKETPLILAFHGGMGTAEIMAENYGLIPKSDKEGFIVAFPNGASRLPSGKLATWNAGNCCGYAVETKSDDVGFVKEIIKDLRGKFNVGKIFATGMSNGGMFSHRLACEMSDVFTAIASVSGTNNFEGCSPKKPISIMHIHGLEDDHVLFNGGCGPSCITKAETEHTSVPDTISGWVEKNNCNKDPQRVLKKEGAYCDLYAGCDDGDQVKLCVAEDGGHSWPGTTKVPNPLEKSIPSQAISATDEIWNFFKVQK